MNANPNSPPSAPRPGVEPPTPAEIGSPISGQAPPAAAEPDPNPPLEKSSPAKPMHHLPRGKNTWNPKILQKWWFWPAAAAALYVLYYVYPLIWDWFAG